MKEMLILPAMASLFLFGCATSSTRHVMAAPSGSATGFLNKSMRVDGKVRHYVVYVPREYDSQKAWPLIVFLHGAGERGDDGWAQADVGLGHAIRLNPGRFPCIVVMPQCPKDVWWDKAVSSIDECLRLTLSEYNIDEDRVFLTGLSMGGYATWQYGAAHAGQFAALMPICGGGRVEDAASLATLPIWAFHGADDSVVKPEESRRMTEAVKNAGGKIRYTEYPETNHNCWDKAYGDPKAITWLLSQKRRR